MAYQQNEKSVLMAEQDEMGRTLTRFRPTEGEKGRLRSAGLRTVNSSTDTSIDPVGSWAVLEHGEPMRMGETHIALGLDWSRSDAPLDHHDGFGGHGRQRGELVRVRVVPVDGELGGPIRILEGVEGDGFGRSPKKKT